MNTLSSLEHKVAWLCALEEIRRVIALYAKAGDDHNNPIALAALLAEDARWTCEGFGQFQGRELIAQELATLRGEDGDETEHWLGATYDCDFVRAADGWKIHDLVLNIKKIVPYGAPLPQEISA